MNYITAFDIRLSKDVYYSGENLSGNIVLENSQNILVKDIRVILRGKAHTHIKLNKAEKCDEKEEEPILIRGLHHFPFQFELPQSSMPCSLETKLGTIRYYVKVIINIPHGTVPQGIKYFTIIGPSTDCMDEKYCCALLGQNKEIKWHGCCRRGALALRVIMDRTAYLCGENVRILAHVENRQGGIVWIAMRLIQHVEYFVGKNAGENKHIDCMVFESKIAILIENINAISSLNIIRTLPVQPYTQGKFDTAELQSFVIPVVPPTLIGVCRLLQIFYILQACVEDEKGNQALLMEFPLTIATLPFFKATMPTPILDYDTCCTHVEGGRYISPEFQIGHMHDNEDLEESVNDHVVLYRPLYVCIAQKQPDPDCCDIDTQHPGQQVKKSVSMISGNISRLTVSEIDEYLEKEQISDDDNFLFDKNDCQKSLLPADYSSSSSY
ncbi:arrestin domain protein [Onchocerca flexuosa]|uniref:Arrestin domain protein n=1 Tax=Onchocerca flexuosa TaxID=387005 RepID=A0A238BLE0_9BILA|nr:arrestin domain protein [Onchocerca flexuosa]